MRPILFGQHAGGRRGPFIGAVFFGTGLKPVGPALTCFFRPNKSSAGVLFDPMPGYLMGRRLPRLTGGRHGYVFANPGVMVAP